MALKSCLLSSLVLGASTAITAASFCDPVPEEWDQIWAEEFDSSSTLNESRWTVTVGKKEVTFPTTNAVDNKQHPLKTNARMAPRGAGFGADCEGDDCVLLGSCRSATCTADNVYIENGTLVLRSLRLNASATDPGNYTTGAVTTRHKSTWSAKDSAFRMCVSAKLPGSGASGQGIWPAHWLMPDDNSCDPDEGEIDIMEMIDGEGISYGTYHWQTTFPKINCSFPKNHKSVSGNINLKGTYDNGC